MSMLIHCSSTKCSKMVTKVLVRTLSKFGKECWCHPFQEGPDEFLMNLTTSSPVTSIPPVGQLKASQLPHLMVDVGKLDLYITANVYKIEEAILLLFNVQADLPRLIWFRATPEKM